ncbi:neurogenic locus notch homolog protein 1-like [Chiloscyllium punctatum]|uniref:neurogenic locus notch homolog protein 1-like n=1 Tax=Chiloscyllium punctatum TaxID=137246 RepID=UPI003B631BCC
MVHLLGILLLLMVPGSPGLKCLNDVNPCGNGGSCQSLSNGTTTCLCVPPYVGDLCQFVDPCSGARCLHGAPCRTRAHNGSVSAFCSCPPGYAGRRCEWSPVNRACLANPCLNQGTCEPASASEYRCRCLHGWTGKGVSAARRGGARGRPLTGRRPPPSPSAAE